MSYTSVVFDLHDYRNLCMDVATLDAMWETVNAAYNMELYEITDEENEKIFTELYNIRKKIEEVRERLWNKRFEMEGSA